MLSIIVAKANNNVIGKDNKLMWHLPEDLKHFKELTTGHNIIMGRKTFQSLGRILPNRHHIVLCRNKNFKIEDENVEIVHNTHDLIGYVEDDKEHFVIGGEQIYHLLMPYCKKMYITQIHHDFDGDAFFPEINKKEWIVLDKQKGLKNEKNPYDYEYITYERI